MIVYHGTIAEYAEAIQRDGLKPESTEAFQLESERHYRPSRRQAIRQIPYSLRTCGTRHLVARTRQRLA